MTCSKCGEELEKDSKFCSSCGAEILDTEKVVETTQVIEGAEEVIAPKKEEPAKLQEEPIFTKSEPDVNYGEKKKEKKGVIALICILVLVIVAIPVYMFVFNTPKQIFNSNVDKIFAALNTTNKNYDSIDTQLLMKLGIKTNDSDMKEISDILKDTELKLGVGIDYKTNEQILNMGLNYKKDELLNLKGYYNTTDTSKVYLFIDELFDKYLEINIEDYDMESLSAGMQMSAGEEKSRKKALNIIKKEIKDALKEEEFSKSKVDKLNKSTLSLSQEEFFTLLEKIFKNLANDEEFLNCFEESKELKSGLLDLADEIDPDYADEDITIEISIYTKGLLNEFAKFEIVTIDSYYEETNTIEVAKEAKDTIKLLISTTQDGKKEELMSGKIKIVEKNKDSGVTTIELTTKDIGTISLEMSYTTIYNKGIEKVDISKAVNVEELTQEDTQKILENLQKMKIYELLEPLLGDYLEPSIPGETIGGSTGENVGVNTVSSYGGHKVTFQVPDNYVASTYNTDSYKTFQNTDGATVTITTSMTTPTEYFNSVEDSTSYVTNSANYTNQTLSGIETMTVGGKTFQYRLFEYEYVSGTYSSEYTELYICYQLDNEYILKIEIEQIDSMTQGELEKFLTIEMTQ